MEQESSAGSTNITPYLELIGHHGSRVPTLALLQALHLRHTCSIPFENLSPFTGIPVKLDTGALMDKFIRQRRGGYCFEQNSVFQHVLRVLGYKTEGLAARVRMHVSEQTVTPRTHMLLLVEINGERFIADTGFGRLTLTSPIRLSADIVQDTPHGPYRLSSNGPAFTLQTKLADEWLDLYTFDLVPHYREDYEVFNWYTSTHPGSTFVNDLVAARPAQAGRHTLRNLQYSFHHPDGRTDKTMLGSVQEIKGVLNEAFHIDTSTVPELDARLSGMLSSHADATQHTG